MLGRSTTLIHTSNIIDSARQAWRQLVGDSIRRVDALALSELDDELAELVFTMQSNVAPLHLSWMREDGAEDDCLFYWLSMRDAPHFKNGSVVPNTIGVPGFTSILNKEIVSIKLYGHSPTDIVYASLVQTSTEALAIATTRWLPKKQRFSRFGAEELAVLGASALQSCVSDQSLELVAELK